MPYVFTEFSRPLLATYTFVFGIGTILSAVLLYAIVRAGLYGQKTDVASIIVIAGTGAWSFGTIAGNVPIFALNAGYDTAVGQAVCQFKGFWLVICPGIVIVGHVTNGESAVA